MAYVVRQGEKYSELDLVNPRLKDKLKLMSNISIRDLSWSQDAREVAYLVDPSSVYRASAQESLPKMILLNASPEMGPLVAYSPDESSKNMLFLAKKDTEDKGYRVAILNKASTGPTDPGTLKFLTEPGVGNAVWSPDGSKIAYIQSGDLWVMDVNGANKKRIAVIGIQFPNWSNK